MYTVKAVTPEYVLVRICHTWLTGYFPIGLGLHVVNRLFPNRVRTTRGWGFSGEISAIASRRGLGFPRASPVLASFAYSFASSFAWTNRLRNRSQRLVGPNGMGPCLGARRVIPSCWPAIAISHTLGQRLPLSKARASSGAPLED